MIKLVKGNILAYISEDDYVAHFISADFKINNSISAMINSRYSILKQLLANPEYKKKYKDGDGYVISTGHVFNLITKSKYSDKSTYANTDKAFTKLAELCSNRNIHTIHIHGLNKLHKEVIFPMVCRIFMEYNINVYIYH